MGMYTFENSKGEEVPFGFNVTMNGRVVQGTVSYLSDDVLQKMCNLYGTSSTPKDQKGLENFAQAIADAFQREAGPRIVIPEKQTDDFGVKQLEPGGAIYEICHPPVPGSANPSPNSTASSGD